jgi:hypothetical protein
MQRIYRCIVCATGFRWRHSTHLQIYEYFPEPSQRWRGNLLECCSSQWHANIRGVGRPLWRGLGIIALKSLLNQILDQLNSLFFTPLHTFISYRLRVMHYFLLYHSHSFFIVFLNLLFSIVLVCSKVWYFTVLCLCDVYSVYCHCRPIHV